MAYSKSNNSNVAFTAASTSRVLSTKAKQVILSATKNCYVSFDSLTVTDTNGLFIAANTPYTIDILYPAFVTVIRATDDGTLSVMELGDSTNEMKITYSATFTGDASLKSIETITFTSDSNLKITVAPTLTGDSFLSRQAPFTGDTNLKRVVPETFTGDTNLTITVHPIAFNSDAKLVTY